jgi:hypothetical protein
MRKRTDRIERAFWCACGAGLAVAYLARPAAAQTNLLADPGFEVSQGNVDASGGDVAGATGWVAFGGGAYTTATIAFDGTQSMKTFGQYNGVYQQFNVTPGQTYTASVYAIDSSLDPMGTGTVGSLELDYFNASGNPVGPSPGGYNVIPVVTGGTSPMDTWVQASLTFTVPAGGSYGRVQLNQTSAAPTGSTYYDDADLTLAAAFTGPPQWALAGGGNWNTAANWDGGVVPDGVGVEADLFGAITAPSTVFADTPITVGILHFNNANEYVVSGAASLTLQAATGSAALVQVDQGTQKIDLPLIVASNATFNVASGADLLIANPITVNSGETVTQTGSGTVTYQSIVTLQSGSSLSIGNSTFANTLSVQSGASAAIGANTHSVLEVYNLNIASGGTLDLANNSLIVDYGSGADPASTVRSELISGYNSVGGQAGNWKGTGLSSSVAAANPSAFALGYADGGNAIDRANTGVPAGEVEVKYTVAGDANLSGGVDLSDLVIIASDFGQTGADWAEGDVNYDGNVDLSDLVIVASNFGASLSSVQAAGFSSSFSAEWQLALAEVRGADVTVPEPIGLATIAAAGLLLRRRRA